MADQQETKYCSNCKRDIASVNFVMHELHCKRNIILCKHCKEPVPRSETDEHFEEFHAKVACDMCALDVEKSEIDDHKENACQKRPMLCPYCDLNFPFEESEHHKDACGSRTDKCPLCNQYVMLKEMNRHEDSKCTYPAQAVIKPKNTPDRFEADPTFSGFPADLTSSFARHEVGRLMNPAGAFAFDPRSSSLSTAIGSLPTQYQRNSRPSPAKKALKLREPSPNREKGRGRNVQAEGVNRGRRNFLKKPNQNTYKTSQQAVDSGPDEPDVLARHLLHDLNTYDGDSTPYTGYDGVGGRKYSDSTPYAGYDDVGGRKYSDSTPYAGYDDVGGRKYSDSTPYAGYDDVGGRKYSDSTPYAGYDGGMGGDGDNDTMIPCEFCGQLLPADELILHESGCNKELAHKPVKYNNQPTNAGPPSPSRSKPPHLVDNRGMYNDWNPEYESSPMDIDNDGVELPCEFCGSVFPMILLLHHQVICELNPTATPRTMTPAVPRDDTVPERGLTRASKRQQDPMFASELNSRLLGLDLEDLESNHSYGVNTTPFKNTNVRDTGPTSYKIPNHSSPSTNTRSNNTNSINDRDSGSASRRRDSAAKKKQILEDLIQNPTGTKNYPILSPGGSGDWATNHFGTRTDNAAPGGMNRKPAAGQSVKLGVKRTGGATNVDNRNGYEASFLSAPQRPVAQQRRSRPKVSNENGNNQNSSGNGASPGGKTKKSYGRTRKL